MSTPLGRRTRRTSRSRGAGAATCSNVDQLNAKSKLASSAGSEVGSEVRNSSASGSSSMPASLRASSSRRSRSVGTMSKPTSRAGPAFVKTPRSMIPSPAPMSATSLPARSTPSPAKNATTCPAASSKCSWNQAGLERVSRVGSVPTPAAVVPGALTGPSVCAPVGEGGCHRASPWIDGVAAGACRLRLRLRNARGARVLAAAAAFRRGIQLASVDFLAHGVVPLRDVYVPYGPALGSVGLPAQLVLGPSALAQRLSYDLVLALAVGLLVLWGARRARLVAAACAGAIGTIAIVVRYALPAIAILAGVL